jgi:D-mannonate dehydratase
MAMTGFDVRAVMPRYLDRVFFVHVRDVVIHGDARLAANAA